MLVYHKKKFKLHTQPKRGILMKNLKTLVSILALLLVTFSITAQSAEKTLVKSFNLQGNDVVLLDLEGDIEVKEWDNPIMRVQISVSIENSNSTILKALVKAGRYNLTSEAENGVYRVFARGVDREVKIKGTALTENLSYTVFAPKDVLVKTRMDSATSAVLNEMN